MRNVNFKTTRARQRNEPESPIFYFHRKKRLLRWDSNPQSPAFKAVALPTEPEAAQLVGFKSHKLNKAKRLIGASLSEPLLDELAGAFLWYIYIYIYIYIYLYPWAVHLVNAQT